jgi:hypothetical protein
VKPSGCRQRFTHVHFPSFLRPSPSCTIYRFGSSTARYATFLTVGAIVAELLTNATTDALWEMNNRGKTYKQVDWSKFDPTDDEEEEEDEEEDDE